MKLEDALKAIEMLFTAGKYIEARNACEEFHVEFPTSLALLKLHGLANLRLREFEAALADLNDVLSIDQNDYESFYFRGLAHYYLQVIEQAKNDFLASIALNPQYFEAHFMLGSVYLALGNVEASIYHEEAEFGFGDYKQYQYAITEFILALSIHDDDADTHFYYGLASLLAKDFVTAQREFDIAIKITGGLTLQYLLATAFMKQVLGATQSALADYDSALAEFPDNLEILIARGNANIENSDYVAAINDLTKAIALAPNNGMLYGQRAEAKYLASYSVTEILADFDQAISNEPQRASHFFHRGKVFELNSQYENALDDYSQAINIAGQRPVYYEARARVNHLLGDSIASEADEQRCQQIEI